MGDIIAFEWIYLINNVSAETLTTDESKNIVGNNILFNSSKLSFIKYKLMLKLHEENPSKFEWLSYTKSILDDSDFEFHLEWSNTHWLNTSKKQQWNNN